MFCVIAAEQEDAEKIIKNLKKIDPFKSDNWVFKICPDVYELNGWSDKRPDILLLSRYLPGEDPVKLLRYIPAMFSFSHIVLMVGVVDESCKGYIKAAKQNGIDNIVMGKLPGEPPYNLFYALQQPGSTGEHYEDYTDIDKSRKSDGFGKPNETGETRLSQNNCLSVSDNQKNKKGLTGLLGSLLKGEN